MNKELLEKKTIEQIAMDTEKLMKQKEFQRLFFWLIERTGAFAPITFSHGLEFVEGRRSAGMELIPLLKSYAQLDSCQEAYLAMRETLSEQIRKELNDER